MNRITGLICGSLVLIGAAARAEQRAGAPQPQTYLAGAAVRDITPGYPIRLSGFGSRRTESEGVTVPIHARALAIGADSDGPAVLIAVDSTGVSDALVSEIARRLQPLGIRRERLAVTATHTHTAPMISGVLPTLFGQPVPPEHQARIDRYTTELTDHLEKVAREALSSRQPARLAWAIGRVGFAKNRRTAGGPTDHALPVLSVRSLDGTLRAVLTTYANHAVTLSHNFIGGDWPGFAAGAIEEKHPGAVALVSIGCGADQNPVNVGVDKVDVARSQGAELAAEVERVLGGPLRPVTGPLTARLERIDLPLAPLPPRSHWETLALKPTAVGYHAQVQLAALDRGESLPVKVDYPVEAWAFGNSLAMVFLAGEVVVDYSLRLKRELDGSRLWVTAYANDTPCYIPSERVLKEGGYEGASAMTYYNKPAPFDVGVEQRIVDAVLRLLPASYRARPEETLARRLLDPGTPDAEREKILADSSAVDAGALITAMARDMEPGTPEEYVRIPWIWRAAVAAGRRNQMAEMKSLLAASLPRAGEPLRDWQAVVLGGGVVHGISLTGAWPADRLNEILRGENDLSARWKRVPDMAVTMAADDRVKTGTRYDALRILGVESWNKRGATVAKYLGPAVHAEVQSGAIGAVNDMRAKEAGPALIAALKNFSDRNRNAALNALVRDDSRMSALLDAVAAGRLTVADLGEARVQKLKTAENKKIRARAEQLLR
jgi:hypothetical protein